MMIDSISFLFFQCLCSLRLPIFSSVVISFQFSSLFSPCLSSVVSFQQSILFLFISPSKYCPCFHHFPLSLNLFMSLSLLLLVFLVFCFPLLPHSLLSTICTSSLCLYNLFPSFFFQLLSLFFSPLFHSS